MFLQSIASNQPVCIANKNALKERGKSRESRKSGWIGISFILLSIVTMFFGSSRAAAQVDQGAIIGVVTDDTGAAIPNADVTLTDVDTGLVLKDQDQRQRQLLLRADQDRQLHGQRIGAELRDHGRAEHRGARAPTA